MKIWTALKKTQKNKVAVFTLNINTHIVTTLFFLLKQTFSFKFLNV